MKKLMMTVALAAFSIVGLYAQESNPNAPQIVFEAETIDYGTIDQNENGEREFKFTNKGKEPLIITSAKASCGCTVPQWPREPIAPGESGTIKVKYDTRRVGPFHKTVTITSNASTPNKVITIKGKVNAKAAEEQAKPAPQKSKVAL